MLDWRILTKMSFIFAAEDVRKAVTAEYKQAMLIWT